LFGGFHAFGRHVLAPSLTLADHWGPRELSHREFCSKAALRKAYSSLSAPFAGRLVRNNEHDPAMFALCCLALRQELQALRHQSPQARHWLFSFSVQILLPLLERKIKPPCCSLLHWRKAFFQV
jgi:hypothetical protein